MLLHTDAFTQTLLHTEAFTHRSFYTQTLSHTEAFTHRSFYAQKLLHTEAFTRRLLYTQTLLRTDAFIYRPFYTDAFTHTCSEISYRITDVECIVGAKTLQSNLTGVNERSVVKTYAEEIIQLVLMQHIHPQMTKEVQITKTVQERNWKTDWSTCRFLAWPVAISEHWHRKNEAGTSR